MSRKGKRYVSDSEDDAPPAELPVKGPKKGNKKNAGVDAVSNSMNSATSKDDVSAVSGKNSKGKRAKGRRGDETEEDDIPPARDEKPKRGKKGRRGADSDSEDDAPVAAEKPFNANDSEKNKGKGAKGKKKKGSISDDESDSEQVSIAASTQASIASGKSKAKSKKGRGGRRGVDSDEDDGFVDLLGMPPAGRGRMYVVSSDDEAPVQKSKKKKKKNSTRAQDNDSEEEETGDIHSAAEDGEEVEFEGTEKSVDVDHAVESKPEKAQEKNIKEETEPEPEPELEPEPEPEPKPEPVPVPEPEPEPQHDDTQNSSLQIEDTSEEKKKKKKSQKSVDFAEIAEEDDYDAPVLKKKKKKKALVEDEDAGKAAPEDKHEGIEELLENPKQKEKLVNDAIETMRFILNDLFSRALTSLFLSVEESAYPADDGASWSVKSPFNMGILMKAGHAYKIKASTSQISKYFPSSAKKLRTDVLLEMEKIAEKLEYIGVLVYFYGSDKWIRLPTTHDEHMAKYLIRFDHRKVEKTVQEGFEKPEVVSVFDRLQEISKNRMAAEKEEETQVFFGEAQMGIAGNGEDNEVDPDTYTGFDANGNPIGLDGEEVSTEVAKALAKQVKGDKLSNRERRAVANYEEDRASRSNLKAGGTLLAEGDEYGIANFSLSQAGRAPGDGEDSAFENSKDIIIESFNISAYKKELFRNASLRIMHGRRYGLLGPNGQGKSTLLKYIAARQLNIPSRINLLYVEQEVAADDTPAIQAVLRADKLRAKLMAEEEKIMKALDKDDELIEKSISKGRLSDAERDEMEDRLNAVYEQLSAMKAESSESHARSILTGLGFTPQMQEMPTRHFSGGWRMRISLARALFMKPDLLLLDEPTNHLDLNAVIWLEDYLSKWKNTLLVVSHDQDFLSGVVTDIIHLEDQKLWYYKGDYEDFKTMHAQKLLKQAADYEKQQKMLKSMKESGKSKKQAEEAARSRAKREAAKVKNDKKDKGKDNSEQSPKDLVTRPREYTVSFKFTNPPELAPPILSVSNVSFQYNPKAPYLFKDISFGIDQTSRIAIVGPNGAGKSTLLNLCIGTLQPTSGEIERNRFLNIGKYSQHFLDVLPMDKSPVDFLTSQFGDLGYQPARALLGRFGLEGHAHTIPCRDLSGGQKARVVFASLALEAPHIMVLDEPTNNLDIESIDALADALNIYTGGVVLVSHDSRLIRSVNCTLWVCDKQTVKPFDGDIDDYRDTFLKELEEDNHKMSDLMIRAQMEAEAKKMAELRARRARTVELRKKGAAN